MARGVGVDPDPLHRQAQDAVLSGLVRGDDVDDLMIAINPNHVPGRFSPDVAMLERKQSEVPPRPWRHRL